MAQTLKIINTVTMQSTLTGLPTLGKHGAATLGQTDPYELSLTNGLVFDVAHTLATATVATLWDDDSNFPATFNYLHFWADQDCYLQLINNSIGTNVVHKLIKLLPFDLSHESFVATANTTLITGGTEPTADTMDSIALGNYSGSTLNYHLLLFD